MGDGLTRADRRRKLRARAGVDDGLTRADRRCKLTVRAGVDDGLTLADRRRKLRARAGAGATAARVALFRHFSARRLPGVRVET